VRPGVAALALKTKNKSKLKGSKTQTLKKYNRKEKII